jgi:hypothetical protein
MTSLRGLGEAWRGSKMVSKTHARSRLCNDATRDGAKRLHAPDLRRYGCRRVEGVCSGRGWSGALHAYGSEG